MPTIITSSPIPRSTHTFARLGWQQHIVHTLRSQWSVIRTVRKQRYIMGAGPKYYTGGRPGPRGYQYTIRVWLCSHDGGFRQFFYQRIWSAVRPRYAISRWARSLLIDTSMWYTGFCTVSDSAISLASVEPSFPCPFAVAASSDFLVSETNGSSVNNSEFDLSNCSWSVMSSLGCKSFAHRTWSSRSIGSTHTTNDSLNTCADSDQFTRYRRCMIKWDTRGWFWITALDDEW